jgi:hypothetical protein
VARLHDGAGSKTIAAIVETAVFSFTDLTEQLRATRQW